MLCSSIVWTFTGGLVGVDEDRDGRTTWEDNIQMWCTFTSYKVNRNIYTTLLWWLCRLDYYSIVGQRGIFLCMKVWPLEKVNIDTSYRQRRRHHFFPLHHFPKNLVSLPPTHLISKVYFFMKKYQHLHKYNAIWWPVQDIYFEFLWISFSFSSSSDFSLELHKIYSLFCLNLCFSTRIFDFYSVLK